MPRANAATNKKGGAAGKRAGAKQPSRNLRANGSKAAVQEPAFEPLMDSSVGRDITGIVLAVVAVVSFIAVVSPSSAPVSHAIASFYHLGFGLGAYVLPFVLLMFAGGLFLREKTPLNVRTLAGGGLMFVCVLSMLSLMVPGTDYATAGMFETAALITSGGYLGAFIASALQAALGKTISMVVLVGLVIVGLVIIGFSVSSFFEMAADRARRLAERRRVDVNDMPWGEDAEHAQAQRRMPSSRGGAAADQQTSFDDLDTAETTFLARARRVCFARPSMTRLMKTPSSM